MLSDAKPQEAKPYLRLLTAEEVYKPLGYKTAKALREAAQKGHVPVVRIGPRRLRFNPEALRLWAEAGGTK